MGLFPHTTRRWMAIGLGTVGLLSFLSVAFLSFVPLVHAQAIDPIVQTEAQAAAATGACTAGGPAPVPCPPRGVMESLRSVGDKIKAPAFRIALIQALLNLSQFVLNRLAYEAAVAIASGGPGEDSLFYKQTPSEAFGQLGLEVAGEAIGSISELSANELGIEFNLCQPNLDLLQLSLALGIKQKYQPTAPKCDFMEVISNWESFGAGIYQKYLDPEGRQDAILSAFASALRPGQNELTATLRINIAIDQKIHEQKLLQFLERNESTYKPVTDFITGTIKTPSETLQADFEEAVAASKRTGEQIRIGELANAGELIGGLALSTASTFTNVLLSKLLERIYTGLFDTEVANPFDLEAGGSGDKEEAQERFASIITTNPIVTTEYDVISQFVVCVAEGVTNRTLNSCVMDVNFLAAVNRGTAGVPLTVQEAIDEGLLDGDWPLIPPDNEAANQDPFCYTYGYCYGNLVKLRKARVVPIGWELAAGRNSESNPATLQEVIDGFNTCTQDGTIGPQGASDSESKWCHLIDPNWVLKYPETECRAVGSGDIRISTLANGRNSECVDAPSCIGEDNDGNCVDGYGYCVSEKNVWRFRGQECPEEYATCLSFTNSETGDDGDFLVSTVDYSVCDQDNAGCRWYRTDKYFEDAGTDDTDDDTYEWLANGDDYLISERDADMNYTSGSSAIGRTTYTYTSDSGETYTYEQYAYEDRLYLTNDATECSEDDAGCTQLYEFDEAVYLNAVRNPSFEDDEDSDGIPDGWVALGGTLAIDTSVSVFGSASVALTPSSTLHLEQFVDVADQNFYTFSAYFQAATSGATGLVRLVFLDEDGVEVSAAGTSSDGDCTWDSTYLRYQMVPAPSASDFERTECLFTVPEGTQQVRVLIGSSSSSSDEVYVDAVQLELGEDASIFAQGYSGTPAEVYYQIAPDYLGCSGAATDPEACDSYAQVCSAQEVGCSLYTPEDGDPNVPAIISELDECPSECVGYTTYKQEATAYESEEFPLYFIADSASSCSQQYVGCDSYTNLGTVEAGGEGIEYYTDLRFCLSNDIADATSASKTPATYFTWEGSDNAGYQLQTWSLLESNNTITTATFSNTPNTVESHPDLAPCTNISMASENEVACDDTIAHLIANVFGNADCDEHDDIFDNPDCREFFDTEGNIHYRQYSDTISISDECAAYRKDAGEETDCEDSGGYWTDQGFCRYYVLSEESTQCPATQNGCREYTGGTGRNATTILNETFEGGTYEDFVIADLLNFPDEISISNESVATEGHSLYVLAPSSGMAGIETTQIYLDASNPTDTYDEDDSTTCTDNGGTVGDSGCDVTDDVDGDGSDDEDCTVSDGEESCGTLTDSLVAGKTFTLGFWAKGSGDLYVTFAEEGGAGTMRDFVDPDEPISSVSDLTPVALDGAWALYSLGPVDTSSYEDFDENAVIRFATDAGMEFYIDNITLKQAEENITIIKDSWVVPSTCDQTPEGVDSDQYYLGCEAYTDHNGSDVDLYQFSDLCSEEVVGCDGFYQTANSESPYTQIYNARCVYSTDTDLTDGDIVTTNTTCEVDDIEYCTISTGEGYCTFDTDQAFPGELPVEAVSSSLYYAIVFGPETVVVSGDVPVYIVEDDNFACISSVMGCQELGEPTYVQDQSEVESFESVYYINLPGDYDNILCSNEALFCEEWESTQDGNFYFKDPLDKTCKYKTSVTIDNRAYFGWFRTDTTEPCYWTDDDGDGAFDYGEEDAYLIAGEEFGVWNNGDEDDDDDDTWDYYDGWVAACDSKYDLCTEFIDVVDTGGGLNEDGQSYYFTNDDLLSEETLQSSQRCNGQVSQKFGCALFNNTTTSELTYNAGASYVLSTHADVFYGTEMNDLVDPISCTTEDGGVFEISSSDAAVAGTDTEVDLCRRRCTYKLDEDDSLTADGSEGFIGSTRTGRQGWFSQSCFVDSDCPVLTTSLGEEETGTCANVEEEAQYLSGQDPYPLEDDTNEVLKVTRDRSCSAWLACDSSRTSWNTSSNKYDTICDSINLCVEGQQQGDRAICSQWDERDATILSAYQYSARDVSWSGFEYSGNSIPNQLPVELYDQFNIEAQSVCVNSLGLPLTDDSYISEGVVGLPRACGSYEDCPVKATARSTTECTGSDCCTTDSDCATGAHASGVCADSGYCYFACENVTDTDYRLVYNAGSCDSTEGGDGNGGSCIVGTCEDSGAACASSDDCADDDSCVVGYCQATGDTNCVNTDCSCNPDNITDAGVYTDCVGVSAGVATPVCDPMQFVCVDELTSDESARDACVSSSDCTASVYRVCVPASTSIVGSCFNDRCLADIRDGNGDGFADRLETDDAREQSCRAYPELDSPFPPEVVTEWKQYSDAGTDTDGDGTATDEMDADGYSPGQVSSELRSSPTTQAAIPYTFVNGFQDSTTCALDEDGDLVDCICSYDKAQYGDGAGYRYFELGTGFESVPKGICSGGPVSGTPCINDDDCSIDTDSDGDFDQAGICSYVSRVDSIYGWNGYCIEKDTSIQTLGSSDSENQACLTWLPVDQLTGGTDLYAKYTSAGFAPQDTYYCAEVKLGYAVGTSDFACAEVQDGNCNDHTWAKVDGDGYTGFKEEATGKSSGSGEDDCIAAVWCPDGFFAVMTGCGKQSYGGMCKEGTARDNDCPFFCVPKLSYKTGDNTELDTPAYAGDPCLDPENGPLAINFDPDSYASKAFSIDISEVADHWAIRGSGEYNRAPNTRVYVVKPDDFADAWAYYNDCYAQGVVDSIYEYTYSDYTAEESSKTSPGVEDLISSGGGTTQGFRGLTHDFIPQAVCTTVVQVSSKDQEDELGDQPFDTYNAAWTDRLWESGSFSITGTDTTHFGYSVDTLLEPFGAAIDYLKKEETEADPTPHELVMCESGSGTADVPLVGLTCDDTDWGVSSTSGEDARAYMDVSITTGSSSGVSSSYCFNSDCDCKDSSREEDVELCNWDDGAAIACEGTCSSGGSEDGNSCVITYDDSACDDDGGTCSAVCVGGSNDGDVCTAYADCAPNICYGSYDMSDGTLTSAICLANGEVPAYTLVSTEDSDDAIARIAQLFGRIYGVVKFTDGYDGAKDVTMAGGNLSVAFTSGKPFGKFTPSDFATPDFSDNNADWIWDTRATAQDNPEKHVPIVVSIGDCEGTQCYEGNEDKFSVNETDSEDIEGEGFKRVTVAFYTYADTDQMPIRRVIVDWGDNVAGITSTSNPWPWGSYSGSITGDNFYKNHRGLNTNTDEEVCSEEPDEFGESTNACSSSYVAFTHDYTCTRGRLSQLEDRDRECEFDEEGRLLNSPCFEGQYCVFQPRVHVMDNWGWCTGTCTAGADGTDGCYTGLAADGETKVNECDIQNCPSEGDSSSCDDYDTNNDGVFPTVNPWINYDGAVYILAE